MSELSLSVGGKSYVGWQSASVTWSIRQLAQSFSVGFTERWNELAEAIPINEGDSVNVKLDNETVINGYVDDSDLSYSAGSHQANIRGRSVLGDLVDCAAIYKSGLWRNTGLRTIAESLCDPFEIDVVVAANLGRSFRRFALQDGESVHDALERAARMRGVLLMSTKEGALQFTRAGSRRVGDVLKRGNNIKSGSRQGSMRDRYSIYIGKAQIPGDDSISGKDVTLKRTETDARVRRYRPTVIMAENEDTGAELQDRMTWERNRRAGEAREVTYVVQGWRDRSGDLWEPNTLIDVDDDWFRIHERLLIVGVTYSQTVTEGSTTSLVLSRKEAYDLIDMPPPKPSKQGEDFYA